VAPRGWLAWGLLGVALAPVVIGLTVTALSYSGYQASSNSRYSSAYCTTFQGLSQGNSSLPAARQREGRAQQMGWRASSP
jgi:hypothetical protein